MIETETYNVYNKGEKVPHEETKPLARSIEMVEAALRVSSPAFSFLYLK
jgi:hypothetical protein